MPGSSKKKKKAGNRSGVSETQSSVTMAAPSGGVSGYNFQAPETSAVLNQANNVLYPPSGQMYVSNYNNGRQFQPMVQNHVQINRQYTNSMNNVNSVNNNNSLGINNNNTMVMHK